MDHLELNLYNFEEEEFAGSKYVLTSPRSLESCDMLNIKPVEIVYKPLSEFQDEMRLRGLGFQDAYIEYNKYEKDRQRKLRECRDYRDKMIRDNIFKDDPFNAVIDSGDVPSDPLPVTNGVSHYMPQTTSSINTGSYSQPLHSRSQTSRPYTSSTVEPYSTSAPTTSISSRTVTPGERLSHSHLVPSTAQPGRPEGWRKYPPFSQRHLSKHSNDKSSAFSRLSSSHHRQQAQNNPAIVVTSADGDDVGISETSALAQSYKSKFMRQKLGLADNSVNSRIGRTSGISQSLPVKHDQDYTSTLPYQRRTYTVDQAKQSTLNRTSTPYDMSATTKPAVMNDSIVGISEIDATSPRYERPESRQRTTSAYANLERETSALRKISSRYDRPMSGMGRSLSLTDLHNQPPPPPPINSRDEYMRTEAYYQMSRPRNHHRAYTSDDEYTTTAVRRHRQAADETDDILARALQRRQREIEEDMRCEELAYNYQLEKLRQSVREASINEVDRLRSGVDSYRRTQRCDDYSRSNRTRVMDYDLRGDYPQLDPPLEDLPDRLKRERRTDLARQQAVLELEAARVKSQKSRLQSSRVRKAFSEALAKNREKWSLMDAENISPQNDQDTYTHVEEVLARSLSKSATERDYITPPHRSQYDRSSPRRHNDRSHDSRDSPRGKTLDYSDEGGRGSRSNSRGDFDRLRSSLRRDESILTQQNIREHSRSNYSSPERRELNKIEERDTPSVVTSRSDDGDIERLCQRLSNGDLERDYELENVGLSEEELKPEVPTGKHRSEKRKGRGKRRELIDTRVQEMKRNLEDRRAKLNQRLIETKLKTEELRAARIEKERLDRERRQNRANKRILKSGKKKPQPTAPTTHQVRTSKSSSSGYRSTSNQPADFRETFDKKVLRAELNNWVTTGQRSGRHGRSLSAGRNQSQFKLT